MQDEVEGEVSVSRHYYSAVYRNGSGELLDVICYHSDTHTDKEVREARDKEAGPWFWSGVHFKKVTSREAMRLTRKLLGLAPYERFYGHIAFVEQSRSCYVFARSPTIIAHG